MKPLLLLLALLIPQGSVPDPPLVAAAAKMQMLRLQRDMNAIQTQMLLLQAEWTDLNGQLDKIVKSIEKDGCTVDLKTLECAKVKP